MVILGVDYGRAHIGLAIAYGPLAEPLKTVKSLDEVIQTIKDLRVEQVVIGLPDGPLGNEAKAAGEKIRSMTGVSTMVADETLSSKDAVVALRHKGKIRRSLQEHQAAAAIILQNYLDVIKFKNV